MIMCIKINTCLVQLYFWLVAAMTGHVTLKILLLLFVSNLTGGITHHGIDYVGIGYNLLMGNPDGSYKGGVDPGFNTIRHIFQLTYGDSQPVPKEVVYHQRYNCLRTSAVFFGAKSYQDKLRTQVDWSGGANTPLSLFSFSLNYQFQEETSHLKTNKIVLQDDEFICNMGSARFEEELADTDGYSVTRNFAASVCQLPVHYDNKTYMQFLDDWGTHVTMQVDVGTKNITRKEASVVEFIKHVQSTGGTGVSVGGLYMGSSASLGVDFDKFKQSDKYALQFGQVAARIITNRGFPEPIGLKVKTIETALNPVYWRSPEVMSVCPSTKTQLGAKTANLRKALEGYATYKMAPKVSDPVLKIPITWPAGNYGLVRTIKGCPGSNGGKFKWLEGSLYQDTEDSDNKNSWSTHIHIDGTFTKNHDMTIKFCIKGEETVSKFDLDWPAGDYCILRYWNNCPTGFEDGYIYWDDEDHHNRDHHSGYLPHGSFLKDTRIDFCCRKDGPPTREILLPTEKPFILFKYISNCQLVHGMSVIEEYLKWDDEDSKNKDKDYGAHPFDDGGSRDHKLHFCYYSPDRSRIIG